ncbi:MAG: 50S ribosomal protein L4 [Firmicutes bacterium]|nr:50S ribosomal protein L4 [Bacillota bacterium]
MIKIDVLDQKGKVAEQITLSKDVFGQDVNSYLIHSVAVAQQNNARQGTKSTLTRSEVRGHAAKPYRQKGTGRARQGSTKAPQFIGGGVAFAPKPRDFTTKVNKKQRHAAFVSAISGKLADKELIVLKDLKIKEGKTKNIAKIIDALKMDGKNILFVKCGHDQDFLQASANIANVNVTTAAQLSVLDIVKCKYLITGVAAIRAVEAAYAGGAK